jgi:uncharacterized membrane protein (DUF4010 family)
MLARDWRQLAGKDALPIPETRNPTELRAAIGFGLLYAAVLLCAAWLSDIAGRGGLYLLALASGLTDVDAITLSTLRLHTVGKVETLPAAVAILLAMLANLAFKSGLAFTLGGSALGWRVLGGMLAVGAGLGGGIAWLLQSTPYNGEQGVFPVQDIRTEGNHGSCVPTPAGGSRVVLPGRLPQSPRPGCRLPVSGDAG